MSTGVPRRLGRWLRALTAGALGVAALTATSSADGAPAGAEAARTETPVASASPVAGITETVVSVRIPLPASVGSHPARCDRLSYLRYRSSEGPSKSADADRILVAQPGILEGAGAFDSVARNTVKAAAEKGEHIEFWALDRRSNCLEDNTGIVNGQHRQGRWLLLRGREGRRTLLRRVPDERSDGLAGRGRSGAARSATSTTCCPPNCPTRSCARRR